jgi:hypothetical protein
VNQRRRVVAAVLIGALSSTDPAAATDDVATVNDASISVDEFEQFVAALPEAGFGDFAADASSATVGAEPGRAALTLLVTNEAQRQFFDGLGFAGPTADERDAAMADTPEGHPIRQTPIVYEAVADDAAYRARLDTLALPDADALRERYEASPASLGVYCATALLVDDRDDADAVIDAYGSTDASWEALAAMSGGTVSDWQCTPLSSVTDPVLLGDIVAAGPGEAIGPVRTSDGFAVLVIDTFDDAAPKLENFFLRTEEDGQTSAGFVLFQGFLATSDITVQPRYGRWDPTTVSIVALGT